MKSNNSHETPLKENRSVKLDADMIKTTLKNQNNLLHQQALNQEAVYQGDLIKKIKENEQLRHELSNQVVATKAKLEQAQQIIELTCQEALNTHEMLLLEIQKAFKESEGYFEQLELAKATPVKLNLQTGSFSRGAMHDQGHHRHWNFTLNQVQLFNRTWSQIDCRLVEHHGNAGLLIFSTQDPSPPPLNGWAPNGDEAGRAFQLIILDNKPSRQWLATTTTSDFILIHDCVLCLIADLTVHGLPMEGQTNWLSVAKRLHGEIGEIPQHLYNDLVTVNSKFDKSMGFKIDFEILNAFSRGGNLQNLKFSWDTISGHHRIILSKNADAPPLDRWPKNPYNKDADESIFYFFKRKSFKERRKHWENLTSRDRNLLILILREIPNYICKLECLNTDLQLNIKSLKKQARAIGNEANALSRAKRIYNHTSIPSLPINSLNETIFNIRNLYSNLTRIKTTKIDSVMKIIKLNLKK